LPRSYITFYSSPHLQTTGGMKGFCSLSKEGRCLMSEQTRGSASPSLSLPDSPSLDWLRKQAKRRLYELRKTNSDAQLADAQFDIATQYGFSSCRALKSQVDSLTVDGKLFDSA